MPEATVDEDHLPSAGENDVRRSREVTCVTGLSLRGDELLIKAREAMIAAVHTFNGAGLHFRAER